MPARTLTLNGPVHPKHALPAGRLPVNEPRDTMWTLYSFQSLPVAETLMRDGIVYPDATGSENLEDWEPAYEWMARKVSRLPGTPPTYDPSTKSVFWAWARQSREDMTRLTKAEARAARESGVPSVLMTLSIAPNRVLTTCFSLWHGPLNRWPLTSERDRAAADRDALWTHPLVEEMEHSHGKYSFDDAPESLRRRIMDTWQRCVVPVDGATVVQATFAHIEARDVVDMVVLR